MLSKVVLVLNISPKTTLMTLITYHELEQSLCTNQCSAVLLVVRETPRKAVVLQIPQAYPDLSCGEKKKKKNPLKRYKF